MLNFPAKTHQSVNCDLLGSSSSPCLSSSSFRMRFFLLFTSYRTLAFSRWKYHRCEGDEAKADPAARGAEMEAAMIDSTVNTGIGQNMVPRLRESRHLDPSGRGMTSSRNLPFSLLAYPCCGTRFGCFFVKCIA